MLTTNDPNYLSGYSKAQQFGFEHHDLDIVIQVYDDIAHRGHEIDTYALGIADYCRDLQKKHVGGL